MKIHAVGDCVIARPLDFDRDPGLGAALAALRRADLVVGNLEVALTDRRVPADKVAALRAPRAMAEQVASVGADVWSLANNHTMDYGSPGLEDTIGALRQWGVTHVGAGRTLAEASTPAIVRARSGETVAVVSYACAVPTGAAATPLRPGIAAIRVQQGFDIDGALLEENPGCLPVARTRAAPRDVEAVTHALRSLRPRVDVVVVALHWGVPWCYLPANQGPLAEYQRPLARQLIDAGADIVIGHHPHALHPVEFYGGGVVVYSAGNFIFHGEVDEAPLAVPEDARRPPIRGVSDVLQTGPWYDSAIIAVEGGPGAFRVRPVPVRLTTAGDPHLAVGREAHRIRQELFRMSRELDASIVVEANWMSAGWPGAGWGSRARASPVIERG